MDYTHNNRSNMEIKKQFPSKSFGYMDKEKHLELSAKAGAVKSMKKKLASQIRYAKQRGLTQKQCDHLLECLCDSDAFDLKIAGHIEEMLNDPNMKMTSRVRADLISKLTDLRKVTHGSKDKAININIMNQFDDKMEEFKQKIGKEKGLIIDVEPNTTETNRNTLKKEENGSDGTSGVQKYF